MLDFIVMIYNFYELTICTLSSDTYTMDIVRNFTLCVKLTREN